METRADNGEGQPGDSPKIITIVRSPLERSWSSYTYNYQKPLIADLRKKDELENKHFSDEYYKNFRYSAYHHSTGSVYRLRTTKDWTVCRFWTLITLFGYRSTKSCH